MHSSTSMLIGKAISVFYTECAPASLRLLAITGARLAELNEHAYLTQSDGRITCRPRRSDVIRFSAA